MKSTLLPFFIFANVAVLSAQTAPTALFSASQTNICAGESVSFTDLSTGSPTSWQWVFEGATNDTSYLQSPGGISYPNTGTFSVSLTVANDSGADTLLQAGFITVNPKPHLPIIQISGATFTVIPSCDSCTFQWYMEMGSGQPDSAIAGATDSSYCARKYGTYYVIVTNLYGCSAQSVIIEHIFLSDVYYPCSGISIKEASNKPQLSLYPNPTQGQLYIQTSTTFPNPHVQVFDFTGKLVLESLHFTQDHIDTKTLGKGIYMLKYSAEDGYAVRRFVVE